MGILRRVRDRGEAFVARHLQERVAFTAEIPGSAGALCELRLEAEAEPQAEGERVRVRAHFRMRLRRATGTRRAPERLPARVGHWIERRLASRLGRVLVAPLIDRDFNAWVELRASSAALDEGSRALVPERLSALGVAPDPDKPVQTWAGGLAGPKPGFAMLTLLQLDKERLPAALQEALGPRPFQLSATVVNVVEDA